MLFLEPFPALRRNEPDLLAERRQSLVGVVLPEKKSVFGARGEQAIRLVRAFGHQIVDHDSDIRFGPLQDERSAAARIEGGVRSGDEPLSRRLLITGRTVDLASKEETGQPLRHQRVRQFGRRHGVVFHGVARLQHHALLKAGNGVQKRELYLRRQ